MAHGADRLAQLARDGVGDLIVPGDPGDDLALGDKVGAQVISQPVAHSDARVGVPQSCLHNGVGFTQKCDPRRLVAHMRERALHRGHVAGAVTDTVEHLVQVLLALHLAGEIPVHIVAGGVALLGIAGHPGGLIAFDVLEFNDGGRSVDDIHAPIHAVLGEGPVGRIAQKISAETAGVNRAESLDRQMLFTLAEEIARCHRIYAGVGKVRAVLNIHLAVAVDVKAHRAPIHQQDDRRRQRKPHQQRKRDYQTASCPSSRFRCPCRHSLSLFSLQK